jgi:Na+/H+ antiporter NhaD/arsenite permease-like protein
MNRAIVALVGAAVPVFSGAITEAQGLAAIDTGTILLLAAMMVINVNLRLARFFQRVRVDFAPYLRVGVPVTILTILVGIVWLSVVS